MTSRSGYVLAGLVAVLAGCKFPALPDVTDAGPDDGDAAPVDGDPGDGAAVDATPSDGTPAIDAPADAMTVNALGQVCDPAANPTTCPTGNICLAVNDGAGGMVGGWCSPNCENDNARCTTGYTGPAGGTPQCALTAGGATPEYCLILCNTVTDCPTGLTCHTLTDPPVSICGVR